jgi:hypothetical protein
MTPPGCAGRNRQTINGLIIMGVTTWAYLILTAEHQSQVDLPVLSMVSQLGKRLYPFGL